MLTRPENGVPIVASRHYFIVYVDIEGVPTEIGLERIENRIADGLNSLEGVGNADAHYGAIYGGTDE